MKNKQTSTEWICDGGGDTTTTEDDSPPPGWGHYSMTRVTEGDVKTYAEFDLCPTHATDFEAAVPVEFSNTSITMTAVPAQ